MLLKDVFADTADLEMTLRSKGAVKAIPYFRALYNEEESLVRRAAGKWVGVSVYDGKHDITEPGTYEATLRLCEELRVRNKRTYCYIALDNAEMWLNKCH
jgi:hypothetical protein